MTDYELDLELLKEVCPVYVSTIGEDDEIPAVSSYSLSSEEARLVNLKSKYKSLINLANKINANISSAEEEYFTTKYGDNIYTYLKDERENYKLNFHEKKCASTTASGSGSGSMSMTISGESIDSDNSYNFINYIEYIQNGLSGEYIIYNTLKSFDGEQFQLVEKLQQNNNLMENELKSIYGETSVNSRKIEYRSDEIMKLNRYNNMLTLFYYFVILVVFLSRIASNELNIQSNWFLYIVVILFPLVIYPYIFKLIEYLHGLLSSNMEFHGPKNAFLNEKIDFNFIDNHDV